MLDLRWEGDRLLSLPNVDRTTLLHQANLYWVPGDEEVVQPAPHHPARPSSFIQPPPADYTDLQNKTTLDLFKRSSFPFEHLLSLRTPCFGTLSKITMMSFMGCLLPRINISKTIEHV